MISSQNRFPSALALDREYDASGCFSSGAILMEVETYELTFDGET